MVLGKRTSIRANFVRPQQRRWYWLGDDETASRYLAKIMLAKKKLLGMGDDGAEILVAAPYEDTPDEAVSILQGFLHDMKPAITASLRDTEGRGHSLVRSHASNNVTGK